VYDEDDGVGMALCITRSAFPDIYAGAVERIRSGASEKELDSFICGEISKRGIPLDNLEFLGYGIPLTSTPPVPICCRWWNCSAFALNPDITAWKSPTAPTPPDASSPTVW